MRLWQEPPASGKLLPHRSSHPVWLTHVSDIELAMAPPFSDHAAIVGNVAVSSPLGEQAVLRRFRFVDSLNRPYRIEMELADPAGEATAEQLLGQGVTVTVPRPGGGERHFHGIVRHFTRRITDGETAIYHCIAVPWLDLLDLGADFQIFQQQSADEILDHLFTNLGFTAYDDGGLIGDYPKLEFCVQYGESHREFAHRLMERFGICYFHEHAQGGHTLKLVDAAAQHAPFPGADKLPFRFASTTRLAEEHVFSWEATGSLQTGSCTVKDYDYAKPTANLLATEQAGESSPAGEFERFEYPGVFATQNDAQDAAKRRSEELACRSREVIGRAQSCGIAVGCTFTLHDCPVPSENGRYLVTGVEIELEPADGADPTTADADRFLVSCRFTAIPAETQYRPLRQTPRPVVQGVQSAVVVGPEGHDPKTPYTDSLGRIKVQFHWDRKGQNNENSSCWLRTPHQSAGNGYGHVWLPRIGCEVLVAFVDGDPDRPTIVGHVYNGQTKLPLDLPGEARVGIIKDDGGNSIKIDATDGGQVLAMFSPTDNSSLKLGKT